MRVFSGETTSPVAPITTIAPNLTDFPDSLRVCALMSGCLDVANPGNGSTQHSDVAHQKRFYAASKVAIISSVSHTAGFRDIFRFGNSTSRIFIFALCSWDFEFPMEHCSS
jgi:hypothetical protein